MTSAYDELCSLARRWWHVKSVSYLAGWDQETYMPDGGAAARAEQQSVLASIIHEQSTSERVGDLIAACEADASIMGDESSPRARNVREFRRDYDLATKLPKDLVEALAKTGSEAQHVWKEARKKSDFAMFRPWLEKMVGLARRKAECYGWDADGEAYDALLNEYEPGMKSAEVERIFTPLGEKLSALVARLRRGQAPDTSVLGVKVPTANQHAFGLFVVEAIGFDLNAGRLDVTTHPFCEGLATGDTRLTTRYDEEMFTGALYGTMHEAGHGIYEQGLPKKEHFGEPLGHSISLGIHESQSRMWENFVGRSREFWTWALAHAQRMLGASLEGRSVEELYRAVNTAKASFIRVEADEATYNLHIMLRFELERALVSGSLKVDDVPGMWNETFKRYVGIEVPDDRRGCLQDVHWSFGLMGYFPTYCLGNLYAAQLWETIGEEIPDLNGQMERGEFGALKSWLNEKIHVHGRRYRAGELCEMVTGRPLSADALMRHLEGKLGPIYGV
jgi:carboxypeptidase Taq